MPLVAIALLGLFGLVAFTMDSMRDVTALQQLQHAARAAAIHAYSRATSCDGTFSPSTAINNMQTALGETSQPVAWNFAPAGVEWTTPVAFTPDDLQIVSNPLDVHEEFVQVLAQRTGSNSLVQFLIPALAQWTNTNQFVNRNGMALTQMVEVIGQPASRIGAGINPSSATWAQVCEASHFVTLPLGISYNQFMPASNLGNSTTSFVMDLVSSGNQPSSPPAPGHIRACFVNVVKSTVDGVYYGTSQDSQSMEQLIDSWKYFSISGDSSALPPACVERGSVLSCFDPNAQFFRSNRQRLIDCLKTVPVNSYFVVPVLSNDPVPGGSAAVVGFARLRLLQALNQSLSDFAFRFALGESVPVRNASFANGLASVPTTNGTLLPPPPPGGPFANRSFLSDENAISPRFRGVAYAPSVSPRTISP